MRLQKKIIFLIVITMTFCGATTTLVADRIIKRAMEVEVIEKGELLAQTIADLITSPVNTNDALATRAILQRIVDRTPEMEYAYVIGIDQLPFAHTFGDDFPAQLVTRSSGPAAPLVAVRKLRLAATRITELDYPFIQGASTRIRIGFNDAHAHSIRQRLSGLLATIVALSTLLGTLVALVAGKKVVAPILQLTKDITAYGRNELKGPVQGSKAAGELRELTEAFNQMISQREATETSLLQSEGQIRLLLEHTGEAIFGLDVDGNCTLANNACVKMLGYSSHRELLGRNIHELLPCKHPDGSPLPVAECRVCRSFPMKEQSHGDDEVFWRADGTSFPVEYWSHPIIKDDEVIGAVVTFIDISKRKAAEFALQKSESRLAEAQRIAHIGNWEWDIATNDLQCSEEVYRILGITAGQFNATYEAFISYIHPDDREQVKEKIAAALQADLPFNIVHRILNPDGQERIVNARARVYRNTEKAPIRMLGTLHDITDIKRTEAELRLYQEQLEELVEKRTANLKAEISERQQAEARLKKLSIAVEESPVSVVITNAHGKIEYVNPKFSEVTQYTADETIGQNPRILKSGHQPKEYYREMWQTILSGKEWHGEFCNRKKDGTTFWELASIAPIHTEDGKISHFVAIKEDITDQKRIISELKKAKEAADEANEAKSLFLSSMSHELRTPLNSILGFAQLLDTDEVNPLCGAHKQSLHRILKSGEHLLHLINEILDLARIEGGSIDMSIAPVDIYELLNDVIPLVEQLAKRQGIEVILEKTTARYHVLADPTRLKQIVMNLLSNAIKYNRPGGEVIVSYQPTEQESLELAVADNGPGIPANKLNALFEPFNRLGAESSSVEGTGIGLTITKRLVELIDGHIDVESELGKGSTFRVTLPLVEKTQLKPCKPATDAERDACPLGNYTLLYIEDNIINRQLLHFILERRPAYKLLTADNAEHGIEIARRQHPDVILMDIGLPDMDGFAALKRLKEIEETRQIPVVALSANAMPLDIEEGLQAGFVHYLTKPLNVGQFFQTIDAVLRRKL